MTGLIQQIEAGLPVGLSGRLGVAVSGGGDSMALLALLHRVSAGRGFDLHCVTVDHGLRPEAAAEAASVARFCAGLGVAHETLAWRGWDGAGNTQNAARQARHSLIADWAQRHAIPAVALGHTQDDQAETVLMRLARAAGVDGLCAMQPARHLLGVLWLRPLLAVSRDDLRHFLRDENIRWHDDPSNEDARFDRIKARKALDQLAPLGIGPATLAQVARNMQDARHALDHHARAAARDLADIRAGSVKLDWPGLRSLPQDTTRRVILAALKWIGGSAYTPRHRSLLAAIDAVEEDASATLEGCRLWRKDANLWIFREYDAVRDLTSAVEGLWDGRWRLSGPACTEALHVAALGEAGLKDCPNWRATGLPRALLLASPAVWQGGQLHAAPLAGNARGWHAVAEKPRASLFDAAITH